MVSKKNQPDERKSGRAEPRNPDELENVDLTFGRSPGRPPVRFVKAGSRSPANKDASQQEPAS